MLKLEKAANTRQLCVSLRDKPCLLTHSFLIALSYALFCHLVALLLFDVAPFKVKYTNTLFPPAVVASDPLISNHYLSIGADSRGRPVPTYLIAPSVPLPSLPRIVSFTSAAPVVSDEGSFVSDLFSERGSGFELDPFISGMNRNEGVILSIHASGGLEKWTLMSRSKFEAKLEKLNNGGYLFQSNEPFVIGFNVAVDQRNGRAFWWEQKNSSTSSKVLYAMALEILNELHFEGQQDAVESGHVEITLFARAGND